MKEIDEILLRTIGMDVTTLYGKFGHKKDWKDFLSDIQHIIDSAKKNPPLKIEGFKKIIGNYEVPLNSINIIGFEIWKVEEDITDYEFFIDSGSDKINGILKRIKDDDGYKFKMISKNIQNTYCFQRDDITIDNIKLKIADFIYNHLIELPF